MYSVGRLGDRNLEAESDDQQEMQFAGVYMLGLGLVLIRFAAILTMCTIHANSVLIR